MILGYVPAVPELVGAVAPPHADDWWRSTDDVLEYARWLDFNVDEVHAAFVRALGRPDLAAHEFGFTWAPWHATWKGEKASYEESTLARVNAWDRVDARHKELVQFGQRARALGIDAPEIEPAAKPDALDKVLAGASTLAWGLFAAGALAFFARRGSQ